MKVLYFAHHGLGDVVMQFPAIHYLCHQFGAENVYLTVQKAFLADFIAQQFDIPKGNFFQYSNAFSLIKKVKFVVELRQQRFVYLIAYPNINLKLTKLLFWMSGAAQLIAPGSEYLLKFSHKVLRNLEFTRQLSGYSDSDIIQYAERYYQLPDFPVDSLPYCFDRYVVLHPGCDSNQKIKRLPILFYQQLISKLLLEDDDIQIILTGAGDETPIVDSIISRCDSDRVISLSDMLSLNQLIVLLQGANSLISGDCGVAHLASIIGTKCITLFGPTDPEFTGPFKNSMSIQSRQQLECMPCFNHKKNNCLVAKCLQTISVDQVLQALN